MFSCLDCILRFVAVEIYRRKKESEEERERKEREKKYFFNSTGISLRRNNVCISYSDCYSALQAWRVTVANLKKILEIERLLEGCFCVNSGFSLQNLEMASPVGDALSLCIMCDKQGKVDKTCDHGSIDMYRIIQLMASSSKH